MRFAGRAFRWHDDAERLPGTLTHFPPLRGLVVVRGVVAVIER